MLKIEIGNIINNLNNYQCYDELEKTHINFVLNFIKNHKSNIGRENNYGHLTASAWIINKDKTKVLLIEHKKLNRWLQPGGHVENSDNSLFDAAYREAKEETNLKSITPLSKDVFDIDVHLIPGRKKEKEHYHLDVRYCFFANEKEILKLSSEVKNVKWFLLSEFTKIENESSITRMIKKTIQK